MSESETFESLLQKLQDPEVAAKVKAALEISKSKPKREEKPERVKSPKPTEPALVTHYHHCLLCGNSTTSVQPCLVNSNAVEVHVNVFHCSTCERYLKECQNLHERIPHILSLIRRLSVGKNLAATTVKPNTETVMTEVPVDSPYHI